MAIDAPIAIAGPHFKSLPSNSMSREWWGFASVFVLILTEITMLK